MKQGLSRAEVVERRAVTDQLFVLRLRPESEFRFRPGQYATLGIDGVERAYSIASAPHEPLIELFIEIVPPAAGGPSPLLGRLQPGREVALRPRGAGTFTLAGDRPHQLMIATVTGVAPFVSMIRDAFHRNLPDLRFYLLHGASWQAEFAYREEMEALAAAHPERFLYVPTVSRPDDDRNAGWTGATGRVNCIAADRVRELGLPAASTRVYACGNPEMIRDVRQRLGAIGFEVRREEYGGG